VTRQCSSIVLVNTQGARDPGHRRQDRALPRHRAGRGGSPTTRPVLREGSPKATQSYTTNGSSQRGLAVDGLSVSTAIPPRRAEVWHGAGPGGPGATLTLLRGDTISTTALETGGGGRRAPRSHARTRDPLSLVDCTTGRLCADGDARWGALGPCPSPLPQWPSRPRPSLVCVSTSIGLAAAVLSARPSSCTGSSTD